MPVDPPKPSPDGSIELEPQVASIFSSVPLTAFVTPAAQIIQLSPRRWFVLFAFFLFGVTSFLTDELSSILNIMLQLLELPIDRYVYISTIFGYLPLFTTMPTAWFVDRYGIRITMYVATILMVIRSIFRALLFNPDLPYWEEMKLTYWFVAGMTHVQALAIYFCMPLKVSENWFSVSERSVAWTVMVSTAGIGPCIAAFVYPRLIHSVGDVKPLYYLNIVVAIITTVTVVSFITRSRPEYPPSERMVKSSQAAEGSYLESVKKMLKSKDVMIHLVSASVVRGFTYAVNTVLQDILFNSGHEAVFIGNVMGISSLVALISLIGLSTLVHRMKNLTLVCKLSFIAQVVLFAIYMMTILYPTPGWLVLLASVLSSISISWASPNLNNMNAHLAAGVVSEATVAGTTTILTLLAINVVKAMFVAFATAESADESTKTDYTWSIFVSTVVCSLVALNYVVLFKGRKLVNEQDDKKNNVSLPSINQTNR